MISCDTNILLYAYNKSSNLHEKARGFLESYKKNSDFVICELVLLELYVLLRNPVVIRNPLSSLEAVAICKAYRRNHYWRIIDYRGGLMNKIWDTASKKNFPRRAIFDVRLAFSLQAHGVSLFATRNVKDFKDFGFESVWNPLE